MSKWSSAFRDSRWQKLRLEVMERDTWTCQNCQASGEGVTLNVHHITYESGHAPWEYDPSDLITWCEKCHREIHQLQKKLLKSIVVSGACLEGGATCIIKKMIGYSDGLVGPSMYKGNAYEIGYSATRLSVCDIDAKAICDVGSIGEERDEL